MIYERGAIIANIVIIHMSITPYPTFISHVRREMIIGPDKAERDVYRFNALSIVLAWLGGSVQAIRCAERAESPLHAG